MIEVWLAQQIIQSVGLCIDHFEVLINHDNKESASEASFILLIDRSSPWHNDLNLSDRERCLCKARLVLAKDDLSSVWIGLITIIDSVADHCVVLETWLDVFFAAEARARTDDNVLVVSSPTYVHGVETLVLLDASDHLEQVLVRAPAQNEAFLACKHELTCVWPLTEAVNVASFFNLQRVSDSCSVVSKRDQVNEAKDLSNHKDIVFYKQESCHIRLLYGHLSDFLEVFSLKDLDETSIASYSHPLLAS